MLYKAIRLLLTFKTTSMKLFTSKLLLLMMAVVFGTQVAKADETQYDYEFNASVLCQADWYGTRLSEGSHTLNAYYLVLGDKDLNSEGYPAKGSTVYAMEFFGAAPSDEYSPNPQPGTYTFSKTIGENVLKDDAHIYQRDGNGNYEIDRSITDGKLVISTYEKDGNTYYKYDLVLTDEIGKTHHVTYESRFIVYNDLSQGSEDLEKDQNFVCNGGTCTYKSLSNGVMKLRLYLTDMTQDEYGDYSYDRLPAREMYLDVYAPQGKNLPNGVYNISDNAGDAYTLTAGELIEFAGVKYPSGTYLQYIYANQLIAWGCATKGTLTVSGEGDNKKIVADFTTDYGFSIKFTYDGSMPVNNIPLTDFTEDKTLDLEGATAQFECIGDYENYGDVRNWYITLLPAEGKDDGFISYICSKGESFYDGIATDTYTASRSRTPWKGEYIKGGVNAEGQLKGTWALTHFNADGQPQVNAPGYKGDLNITQHEDGETYTIEFKLNDGAGHNFTGNWTGKPELINSCGDEPSGINGVYDHASSEVEGVYDLSGRKVSANAKGLHIVKYKNGKTCKQLVK